MFIELKKIKKGLILKIVLLKKLKKNCNKKITTKIVTKTHTLRVWYTR